MKKIIIFLLAFLPGMFYAAPVQAHFLAADGNIGAVLHVDPNDEPIAGSLASFFFEFKDKENKFKPENCDCSFEIDENGKNIYSQPLYQNNNNPSLTNASVFYTFPQRDVYQVKVIGKPLTPNAFQSFTLKWNFRVDQQASSETGSTQGSSNFFSAHLVQIILIGIIIIAFLVYFISNLRKSKNLKKRGG
jgi:hypothetical protein